MLDKIREEFTTAKHYCKTHSPFLWNFDGIDIVAMQWEQDIGNNGSAPGQHIGMGKFVPPRNLVAGSKQAIHQVFI